MPSSDDWMTCRAISRAMGGAFSEAYVRDATYRAKGYHPLPHVAYGKAGKFRKVNWGIWQQWLREEAERSVSA